MLLVFVSTISPIRMKIGSALGQGESITTHDKYDGLFIGFVSLWLLVVMVLPAWCRCRPCSFRRYTYSYLSPATQHSKERVEIRGRRFKPLLPQLIAHDECHTAVLQQSESCSAVLEQAHASSKSKRGRVQGTTAKSLGEDSGRGEEFTTCSLN